MSEPYFTSEISASFVTLYRRQGSSPSPWKRNAKKQNGCLGGLINSCEKRKQKAKEKRKDINI